MLRRMLLGLVSGAVVCGAVAATPPGLQPSPHAEGRELDPVTREHYLPEPPATTNEDSAPRRGPTAADDRAAFWAVLLGAHAAVTDEFTMLLGAVPPFGM